MEFFVVALLSIVTLMFLVWLIMDSVRKHEPVEQIDPVIVIKPTIHRTARRTPRSTANTQTTSATSTSEPTAVTSGFVMGNIIGGSDQVISSEHNTDRLWSQDAMITYDSNPSGSDSGSSSSSGADS
jgi:hypothetical protein